MHVLSVLAYYDRAEDVFNDSLAVLRVMRRIDDSPAERVPRPLSPLGPRESTNLRAERVLADEVLHLLHQGIQPFGPDWVADLFGMTAEERQGRMRDFIAQVAERLSQAGYNPATLDAAALDRMAQLALEALRRPDEGIQNIPRVE
jgi:hypothetical protein